MVLLDSFVWVIFLIFEFITRLKNFFSLKPATYQFSYWAYGRFLGFVTLIAFLSYWSSSRCIDRRKRVISMDRRLSPIYKTFVNQNPELNKWSIRPTFLWLDPLLTINLLFGIGSLSALLLCIGFLPTSLCISKLSLLSFLNGRGRTLPQFPMGCPTLRNSSSYPFHFYPYQISSVGDSFKVPMVCPIFDRRPACKIDAGVRNCKIYFLWNNGTKIPGEI